MASEDAIICVFCGYNTQTRTLGKTKKVIQQTGMDRMTWLWPGIGCAIGIVALVILQIIYVLGLGRSMRTADSVIKYILNEPIYLWVTLMMAGAIWKMGTFAFRRLIIEPTPPEIEAD
jgi:hypothetical protein